MLTRAVKSPIFWYWTHNKNITDGHIGQQCVQFSNIAKSAKSPHPKVQSKAALKTVAFLAVKEEQFANNSLYKFVNNFAHRWCQFPVGFNFCAADVSAFPDKQFRGLAPSFEKSVSSHIWYHYLVFCLVVLYWAGLFFQLFSLFPCPFFV